jgi:hypothetical protein
MLSNGRKFFLVVKRVLNGSSESSVLHFSLFFLAYLFQRRFYLFQIYSLYPTSPGGEVKTGCGMATRETQEAQDGMMLSLMGTLTPANSQRERERTQGEDLAFCALCCGLICLSFFACFSCSAVENSGPCVVSWPKAERMKEIH